MLFGEEVPARVLGVDDADDALAKEERHGELGETSLVVGDVAGVEANVGDALGDARLRDGADDALAQRDRDRGEDLAPARVLRTERGALHEVTGGFVDEVDDAVFEAELRDGAIGDVPEHVVDVARLTERGGERSDDVEREGPGLEGREAFTQRVGVVVHRAQA